MIKSRNLPISAACCMIDSFRALEADWDDEGANPTTEQASAKAKTVLRLIGKELFHVSPLASGGVQIEYRDRHDLEIEVGPEGDLSYMLVIGYHDDCGVAQRRFFEANTAGLNEVVAVTKMVYR